MWHTIRRKFATERKGHAAVDIAAAGGWRDLGTVQMVYQQADRQSVTSALLIPTHRLRFEQELAATHNATHTC
jgi:hypothetical protein